MNEHNTTKCKKNKNLTHERNHIETTSFELQTDLNQS